MVIDSTTDLGELARITMGAEQSDWMFNERGEIVRKPIHRPAEDGVTITIDCFVNPCIRQKA